MSKRLGIAVCLAVATMAVDSTDCRAQAINVLPLQARLREYGIRPTIDGVRTYLKDLTPSADQPAKVARLIKQLGSGRFQDRQQASRLLLKMPVPPLAALREAAEDRDLEIRYRARAMLRQIKKGDYETRLTLVAGYIGYQTIPQCAELILNVAPNWNDPFVVLAFQRALSIVTAPNEAGVVEQALVNGPSLQRQVAMGALPALYQGDELRKRLLELAVDNDPRIRLTAAELLANSGDPQALVVFFRLLKTGGADQKRVVDDIHGLLGNRFQADMTNAQLLLWRTKNPGALPFRFPVDDAVVARSIQRAGGKVAISHEGSEVRWYTPQEQVPAGEIRVVGIEKTSGSISGPLLMTLRRTGHVRRVSLSGSTVSNASLAELRDLFQLTHLDLNGCVKITDSGLQALKRLPALEELDLSSTNVTAAGLRHLADHEFLRKLNLRRCRNIDDSAMSTVTNLLGLRELDIDETRVTGSGLKTLSRLDRLQVLSLGRQIDDSALASARGLPLVTLKLNYSRVTTTGMRHLATLEKLKVLSFYRCGLVTDDALRSLQGLVGLEDVRLTVPRMTDAGLKHLAGLKNLKRLSLYDTRINGAGLKHLARLAQLEELDLGRTPLTDAGLGNLQSLSGLKSVNLRTTPITDDGLKALAGMKQLQQLNLESTRVTGTGLAGLNTLGKLTELRMHNSRLTDANVQHIAKLKNLEFLDISNTQVTNASLKWISELPRLKRLDISRTSISDKGLKQLHGMQSLRSIRVRLTSVTATGANALADAVPGLSWSR